jgi:23S rRNA (adenine2503-C2)-methyltransferase
MKKFLLDLTPEEIEKEIEQLGQSPFRARQIVEWIYKKRTAKLEDFTNLPLAFRRELEEKYILRSLKLKDKQESRIDGTTRYNFETSEGYIIPCVFLPSKDRNTVCISSQAGCPVGCTFCASGKSGFKRDLKRGEILEQIIEVQEQSRQRVTGVLFMGMGEPFLNYDNVLSAVRAITDFRQLGLGRRHVTVSTVGVVSEIRRFADEMPGVRLALSLHAADDVIRTRLIGEKIRYSVKEVLEAGLYYTRKNNARLTIEYIVAAGVNDSQQDAEKLGRLFSKTMNASDDMRINLIPFNCTERSKLRTPKSEELSRFKNDLAQNGVMAMIRQPKGLDIDAACGQLGV